MVKNLAIVGVLSLSENKSAFIQLFLVAYPPWILGRIPGIVPMTSVTETKAKYCNMFFPLWNEKWMQCSPLFSIRQPDHRLNVDREMTFSIVSTLCHGQQICWRSTGIATILQYNAFTTWFLSVLTELLLHLMIASFG